MEKSQEMEEQQEQNISFDVDYYDDLGENDKKNYLEKYKEWNFNEPENEKLHGNDERLWDGTQMHTAQDTNEEMSVAAPIFGEVKTFKCEPVQKVSNNKVGNFFNNESLITRRYKFADRSSHIAIWDGSDRQILVPFEFPDVINLNVVADIISSSMNVVCLFAA